MRPSIKLQALKLILIVAMASFFAAMALGDGPADKGPPGGNAATPGEAALNAIFDRIRHPEQAGTAEIIPTAANPTLVAAAGPTAAAVAPAGGSQAVAAPAASPAADADAWRYQWFDGRWWYWMPDQHWVWWDQGQGWSDYSPPSVAAAPQGSGRSRIPMMPAATATSPRRCSWPRGRSASAPGRST